MYYFLAISLDADVLNGAFWPAYILCKSYTTSEKRSGWRILHQVEGMPTSSLPRVLVTETTGHEDMIEFMSSYQIKDGKTGKHFHPYGALCWYSCNKYGEPTGETVFIKKVPEWRWIFDFANRGFQKVKKMWEKKPALNELLSSEPNAAVMTFTDTKLKLHQQSHSKDLEEYRRRHGNANKKSRTT